MENYRMNYRNNSCRRPGCAGHTSNNPVEPGCSCGRRTSLERKSASCKSNSGSMPKASPCKNASEPESRIPSCAYNSRTDSQMPSRDQIHWGDLPPAMAYIPSQKMYKTYSPSKGLSMGTIFPDLCKPFCGKGGGCH